MFSPGVVIEGVQLKRLISTGVAVIRIHGDGVMSAYTKVLSTAGLNRPLRDPGCSPNQGLWCTLSCPVQFNLFANAIMTQLVQMT